MCQPLVTTDELGPTKTTYKISEAQFSSRGRRLVVDLEGGGGHLGINGGEDTLLTLFIVLQ